MPNTTFRIANTLQSRQTLFCHKKIVRKFTPFFVYFLFDLFLFIVLIFLLKMSNFSGLVLVSSSATTMQIESQGSSTGL